MKETRSVWLVTKDGKPMGCVWACVKTYTEGEAVGPPMGKSPSWCAALDANQLEADGWDATPTKWRRVPTMLQTPWLDDPDIEASVTGREATVSGVKWNLDREGKPRKNSKSEPDEPEGTVVNEAVLADQVEHKKAFFAAKLEAGMTEQGHTADEIAAAKAKVGLRVGFRDIEGKKWEVHAGGKPPRHGNPDFLVYKEAGMKKKDVKQ